MKEKMFLWFLYYRHEFPAYAVYPFYYALALCGARFLQASGIVM